jgi:hypothetical protein
MSIIPFFRAYADASPLKKGGEEAAFEEPAPVLVNKRTLTSKLLPVIKLPGLEEHVGVVDSASVFEYLQSLESTC